VPTSYVSATFKCSDLFKYLGMAYHLTLTMTASSEHAAIPMLAAAHRILGLYMTLPMSQIFCSPLAS